MSNIILLSAGLFLPNQSTRQSEEAILCGQLFPSAVVIQKLTNRSKKTFTNVLYITLKLYNIQYKMIVFTSPLTITKKKISAKVVIEFFCMRPS